VLGKEGVVPSLTTLWGPGGARLFEETPLGEAYEYRVESLRDLIGRYDREVTELDGRIHLLLRDDVGYQTLQQLSGVGRVFAGVLVAEIGEVTRIPNPIRLCSWVGLSPRHRESDDEVFRGSITKQGSALVRWAAVEAVARWRGAPIRDSYLRIAERRGTNIARVAAARKLVTLVFYGMRDVEIRCLEKAA
jgi:transposase